MGNEKAKAPLDGKVSCQFAERRCQRRPLVTIAATILEPDSETRIEAHTTDVTLCGCYLDTANAFPVGKIVELRLTNNGKVFHSRAKVIYSKAGVGMGMSFGAVERDQFAILEEWLNERRGEGADDSHWLEQDETGRCGLGESDHVRYAVEALLVQLMRKGVLNDEEGEPILRHLLH